MNRQQGFTRGFCIFLLCSRVAYDTAVPQLQYPVWGLVCFTAPAGEGGGGP
jgi:hypothetical protein